MPALAAALTQDDDAAVRAAAANALGSYGRAAKDALPALTTARGEADAAVREAADRAIARVGSADPWLRRKELMERGSRDLGATARFCREWLTHEAAAVLASCDHRMIRLKRLDGLVDGTSTDGAYAAVAVGGWATYVLDPGGGAPVREAHRYLVFNFLFGMVDGRWRRLDLGAIGYVAPDLSDQGTLAADGPGLTAVAQGIRSTAVSLLGTRPTGQFVVQPWRPLGSSVALE